VNCLQDRTASSSPRPTSPDDARDPSPDTGTGRARGARDFLAALNQGQGQELLDAYIENRNDRTRNALAMHYGLCAQVVARQIYRGLSAESRSMVELEDLEQTAHHLLLTLVEKFDCSLGIPLSAFLTRRLRFALIDDCRSQGLMVRADRGEATPKIVSLDSPRQGGRALAIVDARPGPAERAEGREARKTVLRGLSRTQRLFVLRRFLRGLSLAQVARRLRMTADQAGKLQLDCLTLIKKTMGIKMASTAVAPLAIATKPAPHPGQPTRQNKPVVTARGPLPTELRRAKAFRRWFVHRVPWAYRKVIAYRYFRGREIEWTAAKLGLCPDRVRLLDRQAQPLILRAVREYQCGLLTAA
jgi:RNA polymerase sigma factor (sigma-70 family)